MPELTENCFPYNLPAGSYGKLCAPALDCGAVQNIKNDRTRSLFRKGKRNDFCHEYHHIVFPALNPRIASD